MSAPRGATVRDDIETLDEAEFRRVLSRFASGVVVVTGTTGSGPAGLTCQSFSSLSLDPPLVLFSVARTSTTWPRIEATGSFAVNVLAAHQEPISRRFAMSGIDKFAGQAWRQGRFGNPLLDGALAHVECDLHSQTDGGDHVIVTGRVRGLESARLASGATPLVFFEGRYRDLR